MLSRPPAWSTSANKTPDHALNLDLVRPPFWRCQVRGQHATTLPAVDFLSCLTLMMGRSRQVSCPLALFPRLDSNLNAIIRAALTSLHLISFTFVIFSGSPFGPMLPMFRYASRASTVCCPFGGCALSRRRRKTFISQTINRAAAISKAGLALASCRFRARPSRLSGVQR